MGIILKVASDRRTIVPKKEEEEERERETITSPLNSSGERFSFANRVHRHDMLCSTDSCIYTAIVEMTSSRYLFSRLGYIRSVCEEECLTILRCRMACLSFALEKEKEKITKQNAVTLYFHSFFILKGNGEIHEFMPVFSGPRTRDDRHIKP
jgi:hypothetical protein